MHQVVRGLVGLSQADQLITKLPSGMRMIRLAHVGETRVQFLSASSVNAPSSTTYRETAHQQVGVAGIHHNHQGKTGGSQYIVRARMTEGSTERIPYNPTPPRAAPVKERFWA